MRRAVVQNLRAFRRSSPRKAVRSRFQGLINVTSQRSIATRSGPVVTPVRSRRISQAVLGLTVGTGAWYTYAAGSRNYALLDSSHNPPLPGQSNGLHTVPVKKALVVERGELYTGYIPESRPVSKDTDQSGRKVLEMMTDDQVSAKLRTNEESYLVGRGRGVVRYDVVQIPSNDPIEDDHAEKIIDVPQSVAATDNNSKSSDWMFWGVFDGHAGWTTSAKLRQTLISFVARELNTTYSAARSTQASFPAPAAIDAAIKQAFLKLDHEITHGSVQKVFKAKSKPLAAELLGPALSGSCALLSFYDSRSRELRVACAGDSRAVLGRRTSGGKWTATPLSIDQTGGTESEAARLRAEHPNEPYVTANGRILGGLEPSRAFGDATYKWSLETQSQLKQHYFGRTPSKYLKTPPYVTAEPVITTTKINPGEGDFVVMATDGLWEMLTNDEVIGLVGMWLEKHGRQVSTKQHSSASSASSWLPSFLASRPSLPVDKQPATTSPTAGHNAGHGAGGQRAPIRQEQWGVTGSEGDRFVVEDKNAATHLVRNALGGRDREMVSALLTLPSPFSRRYRDDLTVEVIFFGDRGEAVDGVAGEVEVNREASADANKEIRPRL